MVNEVDVLTDMTVFIMVLILWVKYGSICIKMLKPRSTRLLLNTNSTAILGIQRNIYANINNQACAGVVNTKSLVTSSTLISQVHKLAVSEL